MLFRSKNWTPLEISVVSVPADSTVGIGRNLEDEPEQRRFAELSALERLIQLNETKGRLMGQTAVF